MTRKNFLRAFVGISGSAFLSKFIFSRSYTRTTTVYFPEGKSLKDYRSDRSQWIQNTDNFKEFLAWAKRTQLIQGHLTSYFNGVVTFKVKAETLEKLMAYEKLAANITKNNHSQLVKLGYSFKVKTSYGHFWQS